MDQCQWPRTSSLYGDERKSKKNKKKASQTSSGASDEVEVDYDEMEFRFLSDRLSGPLTIIHAMSSLGDGIAAGVEVSRMRDLTVHIVGANVNEMLGIIKWEYLAHRLPALEKCRIVFIGPELAEQVTAPSSLFTMSMPIKINHRFRSTVVSRFSVGASKSTKVWQFYQIRLH